MKFNFTEQAKIIQNVVDWHVKRYVTLNYYNLIDDNGKILQSKIVGVKTNLLQLRSDLMR